MESTCKCGVLLSLSLAAVLGVLPEVRGATLYWDANGGGSGTGGTGNWNTVDLAWRNGSATGTLQPWANANTNQANLGGTAGTLTLTENIVALPIGLSTSGYVINNVEGSTTSGKTLTLDGTGGSGNYIIGLNVSANNLTINAPVVLTGYTVGIRAQGSTTVSLNGNISGERGLNTHLSGTAGDWKLVLNGNNSFIGVAGDYQFHGGVYHSYGTLVVGCDTALGTGNLRWESGTKLQAGNGNRTVANTLRFPNEPSVEFTGANSVTFTTDVPCFYGTGAKFTVADPAATLTFGSLQESQHYTAGPFEKLGAGTLAITRQFGCGGTNIVTAGTLVLNGDTFDTTASGKQGQQDYTVDSGAALGGTGTIWLASGKTVTVSAGGALAPGGATSNSIGTLTVTGAVKLATGAVYRWECRNGAGDLVALKGTNGTLTLPSVATVHVRQVSGDMPSPATLFTATALAGATDLSGWTVIGPNGGTVQIDGTSVVLRGGLRGNVISIR